MNIDVHFDHLGVELGGTSILEDVTFSLVAGKLNALIGPNGAGKTTLVHALLGFIPHSGEIRFGETATSPRIGFVPQRANVDRGAPVTVADFLAAGMTQRPVWTGHHKSLRGRIDAAMEDVGIPDRTGRRLDELSGGEFQRVLLAQALLREPDLLILDEPDTGVDIVGHELFCSLVEQVHRSHQMTTLLITHDIGVVADHAFEVVGLNRTVVFTGRSPQALTRENLVKLFGPHSTRWARGQDILSHNHEGVEG